MKKSRIAVLATLVLAFVCSIVLSVFSMGFAEPVAKTIDQANIYMRDGAAVRLATTTDEMGLRFASALSQEDYEGLKLSLANGTYSKVEVGMVILPKDYVEGFTYVDEEDQEVTVEGVELSVATLFGEGKRYHWEKDDEGYPKVINNQAYILHSSVELDAETDKLSALDNVAGHYGFKFSIVNIKDGTADTDPTTNNIDREFISTAYIAATDAEGTTYKLAIANKDKTGADVADTNGKVSRCVAEVAYDTINDEGRDPENELIASENEKLDSAYLQKCLYDIVIKDGENVVSTQQVKYGASCTVQTPAPPEKYRVRSTAVLKDENQNVTSTNIEKVTANATYTLGTQEEYVLMDMSSDSNVFITPTAATTKQKWEKDEEVVYPGEDASLKLQKTVSNGFVEAYQYLDRNQLLLFNEVKFRMLTSGLATIRLTFGTAEYSDTRILPGKWREVRIVNTNKTSRTFDLYIDGDFKVQGSYDATASKFTIIMDKADEVTDTTGYALYLSDIIGYGTSEKEVVIFNNGGYDAKGERDIFRLVTAGTTYTIDDLMTGNTIRKTRTGYGSVYTEGVRDVIMYDETGANGDFKEVIGYSANGVAIYRDTPCVVNETTVIAPILGDAVVIGDFETATLVDEDQTANASDVINGENGQPLVKKYNGTSTKWELVKDRAFRDQETMFKVLPATDYAGLQLHWAGRPAGTKVGYQYDYIMFHIAYDKVSAATTIFSGATAPANSTGCTVLIKVTSKGECLGDIYVKASTGEFSLVKSGASLGANYVEFEFRTANKAWYISNIYALDIATTPAA